MNREETGAFRVIGKLHEKNHPADGMTAHVHCGDGAYMTVINPQSFAGGGPEWTMRYGDPVGIRYSVASILGSYDYLLSRAINMKEATQRLRLLRKARAKLAATPSTKGRKGEDQECEF